jgi:hypothetical protein
MAVIKFSKVVSSLPGTLDPNTAYLVRVGSGFDLYVTDSTGSVAYQTNVPIHTHTKSAITDLETITVTPTANAVPKADSSGKISLNWLTTGSGSGLDADMLDGFESSQLLLLGDTSGNVAGFVGDLNTLSSGPTRILYASYACTNKPPVSSGGFMLHIRLHASAQIQHYWPLTAPHQGWSRSYDGTTWTSWSPYDSGGGASYDMLFAWVKRPTSKWHILGAMTGAALAGPTSLTASRIYYYPFVVPRDVTIDQLGMYVGTGASGVYASVGIYGTAIISGAEYPGNLLGYVTDLDCSTTGIKSGALSQNLTLYAGELYWSALIANGTPAIWSIAIGATTPGLGTTSGQHITYLYASGSGYSLPSQAGSSFTDAQNANVPAALYAREVIS